MSYAPSATDPVGFVRRCPQIGSGNPAAIIAGIAGSLEPQPFVRGRFGLDPGPETFFEAVGREITRAVLSVFSGLVEDYGRFVRGMLANLESVETCFTPGALPVIPVAASDLHIASAAFGIKPEEINGFVFEGRFVLRVDSPLPLP